MSDSALTTEQKQAIAVAAARLRLQQSKAPKESEAPEEDRPSFGQQLLKDAAPTIRGAGPYAGGAALGAAAGSALPGVGTVAGGIAGAGAVGLADLGLSIYNPIAKMTGLPEAPTSREVVGKLLTKMGVPESETPRERIIESVAGGVAGGASSARNFVQLAGQIGPGAAKNVIAELGKGVGAQATSGGMSSAAAQVTAEMGGGQIAQLAAGIGAGALPGVAKSVAGAPFRGSSSESEIQKRVSDAKAIGMKPSVAYSAPSVVNRAATKALAGTEEIKATAESTRKALETEVGKIAEKIGKVETPNRAGQLIEQALGKEGFMARAGAVEEKLWTKWFGTATAKGQGEMPVSNTMNYLQKSQKGISGYEGISELLKDKQLGKALQAFESDLGAGKSKILGPDGKPIVIPGKQGVPYEAIKELRTIIGEKLDPQNLSPDVSKKALKGLYGALSEDMKAYAKQLGPEAEKEFNRANNFTRGKMQRVEDYLQETQGRKPYQVWRYATSPDSVKDGGQQFLTLNKSMSVGERETFHATFIKQMGKNEQGEFDPEVFRAKYKQLSPQVQSALLPESQRPAMDRLMRVIDGLDRAGTLQKPSNNTSYLGAYMLMGAILHAHPKALITTLFASGKTEKLAKMLTSPEMVDHISGVNKIPKSEVANAMTSFIQAAKTIPPEKEE